MNKFLHLEESVEKLSSELEVIKSNIQKRKSEHTTLKILFYTGFITLLAGFIYTSLTLQKAQIQSLETNINILHKRVSFDLVNTENKIRENIQRLHAKDSAVGLEAILIKLDETTSRLEPESEKIDAIVAKVRKDSEELKKAYAAIGKMKTAK